MSSFRWTVSPGDTIRVYRNLHRACWSVQTKVKVNRSHIWKVAGWADAVAMENAVFVVYEKGRKRVLATGRKNVHSFVVGRFAGADDDLTLAVPEGCHRIAYNPRALPYFHCPDFEDRRVDGADAVYLTSTGRVYGRG